MLQCDDFDYVIDQEKDPKLNYYITSCFNSSHPPLQPTSLAFHAHQQLLEDLYCTVGEVKHVLHCPVSSKVSGPNKTLYCTFSY